VFHFSVFGSGNGSNSSNANTGTSTGATSRSKNAPGNRTNIGCKHVTDVLGNGKKVKCNYCSKINNGGIFRFKHHLAGTRWDSKPCALVPEEVKMLMMKVVAEVANASEKRRKLNSIHEEGINTDVMLQEFRDEWKKTGCSIMSDGWTDKKRHSICNFLVNSPKGIVFLYSLDTSDISKIANKVLKMLDDVVNFVGEENVVQVITDNAANYKVAGELLMQKREHLYWTPRVAHCIDLIFEDFEKHLKVHQTTIKKGSRITTHIYGKTMLISIMKKFTNGRDLIRSVMTRFATTYLNLACLHELKASLMSMFSSKEWKTSKFGTSQEGRKVQNAALDSRFWKNVTMCLKVAAPLMVILQLVDSDVKPPMGFIYEEMENAKEKIK